MIGDAHFPDPGKYDPAVAATIGMVPILSAKKCILPASYLWRHPDYHLTYTADKITL